MWSRKSLLKWEMGRRWRRPKIHPQSQQGVSAAKKEPQEGQGRGPHLRFSRPSKDILCPATPNTVPKPDVPSNSKSRRPFWGKNSYKHRDWLRSLNFFVSTNKSSQQTSSIPQFGKLAHNLRSILAAFILLLHACLLSKWPKPFVCLTTQSTFCLPWN